MELICESVNGALVIEVRAKRLDSSNSARFKSRMADYVNAGRARLAIDLSAVEFMDSTGLAALISTLKAASSGGGLAVFGLNERLKRLFSITRLDRGALGIAESRSLAVDMVTAQTNSRT